jgi:hypothetical protein
MQHIDKNQTSKLYLTLTEATTLTSPRYLIVLTSRTTKQVKAAVLGTNLSSYTYRVDIFNFTEAATDDAVNAQLNLQEGEWEFVVYEQTSSTNLNPDLADTTTPIERGILLVKGAAATPKKTYNAQTKTKKVYNG